MTQKTIPIQFIGASSTNTLPLPFFFNRSFPLSPEEAQRALTYAAQAKAILQAYYKRSDYPHLYGDEPEAWEIAPSTFAAYAFFLKAAVKGRIFRYGAIFNAVGVAAARLHHVDVLQWLICEGIPLDELRDSHGNTVLTAAIGHHHEPLAHALLEAYPRFSIAKHHRCGAMFAAVFNGSVKLFFDLVKRGFPCAFMGAFHGWYGTLLSAAIRRGRHTITRYLLKHAFTKENLFSPDWMYASKEAHIAWPIFVEAIGKQNREVIEHCKAHRCHPPLDDVSNFAAYTGILHDFKGFKFVTEVYPELPLREYITHLRMDQDYCVDDEILAYYNLPPNEAFEPSATHDWRYDIPTTPKEIDDCLEERPDAILRLIPLLRNELRAYYQSQEYTIEAAPLYALCLAQHSPTPLFTTEELQALVDANEGYRYYSFHTHAKTLGIKIPKEKPYRSNNTCWRIAALQGQKLQDFLDQSDDVLQEYDEFFDIPIIRFIAEASTVEALELWMERGIPICACEENESWHPTRYANAEILNYYLSEVGMHYRTRTATGSDTLASAISANEIACIDLFIKQGYPLNHRKCSRDYPLTHALIHGDERAAKFLYASGAKMLDRKGHIMQLPSWVSGKAAAKPL